MKRKLILALAAVALLFGIAIRLHHPHWESTLTLYSLGDYIDPSVLEEFTEQSDIRVQYIRLDMQEGSTKPLSQCDVLLSELPCLMMLKEQGQLMPLKSDDLYTSAEYAPVYGDAVNRLTDGCAVPALWSTMGLLYNPETSETMVRGWADLFDPAYPGKIASTGNPYKALAGALLASGWEPNTPSAEQCLIAQLKLDQNTSLTGGYHFPRELKAAFRSEGVTMAPCYAGQAVSLMAQMPELSFVLPCEGSWQSVLGYALPRQCSNPDAALTLLNYLCQPYQLAKNAAYSGWSTPSLAAYRMLSRTWKQNPLAYSRSGLAVIKTVPVFAPELKAFTILLPPKLAASKH